MIELGSLVTQKGPDTDLYKVEKVVDRDRNLVKVRSVSTDATMSVDVNNLIQVTASDILKMQKDVKERAGDADNDVTDDPITDEQYALAQVRFNAFKRFEDGDLKTKEAVCAELKIGRSTFYTLLGQFDESVGVASMVVNSKGRKKGSTLLSEDQEDAILYCYNKYALKEWTLSYIHSKLQAECYNREILCPSLSAMRKRILDIDPADRTARREGKYTADDMYVRRKNRRLTRPLQELQLDHTLADIFLRSETDGKPIGRPYLSLAVCSYTGVIVGFHLSFDAPSSRTVSNLLLHALMPKIEFMEKLGLGGLIYPYYGKPEKIFTDNAKEFRSKNFRRACRKWAMKVSFRQSKQAGGKVERTFGALNTKFIHLQRGTTCSHPRRTRDFDPAKDSVMTYREFLIELTKAICQHNETADYKGKSPARRWREYYTDANGRMLLPEAIFNPKRFSLEVLPERSVTCTNCYVEYRGIQYDIGEAQDHTRRKLLVKPDALNIRMIWAYLSAKDKWIELDAVDKDILPRTMTEFLLQQKLLDQQGHLSPEGIKATQMLNEGHALNETKYRRAQEAGLIDTEYHSRSERPQQARPTYQKRDFTKRASAMLGES
ncbi:DDE-type integrase/transposase/recombinase [Pseudomonas japonica]|uniref:Integrase core domain-containing protein n=1 Tax=Pseudomonas japonica TaxID=256466 RepID=A0A239C4K5_9PSED|nr:DDE-type integrase/transposase/recombinase [Pseudomonas japonica]SNS14354.1 Integrase core domain-containing protein [Pseudomonas japonica]